MVVDHDLDTGRSSDPQQFVTVAVVGTTGDVAEARRRFARFYPFNPCAEQVRYSRSDLDDALRTIHTRAPGVDATLDARQDRVAVSTVAYESAVHDAVASAGRDKIVINMLVTWTE